MNENPLVSVVVVTYNSSKTVVETLDSIAMQTYNNIELIVSDDCSKDNTVEIVEAWLNEYKCHFVRTELVKSKSNTGTAGNLNRGYTKTNGIWIKGIAGDDKLMNTCIESNIEYVKYNPNVGILLSKVKPIGDNKLINKYNNLFKYGALELDRIDLLCLLLVNNFLPASTLFINKNVYRELGGYDESMPLLEDWPFWIKALYNNKSIAFNNDYTVYYRMSEASISLSSNLSPLYLASLKKFKNDYLPKFQWKTNRLLWFYYKCNKIRSNRHLVLRMIAFFLVCINPISYYIKYLYAKVDKLNCKYCDCK